MSRVATDEAGFRNAPASPARTESGIRAGAAFSQALRLAAAAWSCWRAADRARDRWVLAGYILRNLARRLGISVSLATEISLSLGGVEFAFRPLEGELYLYQEIFVDRVHGRHPAFRVEPGWCVMDAGANIGMFTLEAACRRHASRVYAFEPHPETFLRLVENLRRNSLENVVPIESAVGGASGLERMSRGRASTVAALDPAEQFPGETDLFVEVTSLAEIIEREKLAVVHLLKLDVEGGEAAALRGAEPVLGRIERIVMEYHSPRLLETCERILTRHGFRKVLELLPSYAYFLGPSVGGPA